MIAALRFNRSHLALGVIFFFMPLFLSQNLFAGTIVEEKNGYVRIRIDKEALPKLNQKIQIYDQSSQKLIAIGQVVTASGNQLMARILKGTAKAGDRSEAINQFLKPLGEGKAEAVVSSIPDSASEKGASPAGKKASYFSKFKINFGVGMEFVSSEVVLKATTGDGAVPGNGFGVKGVLDFSRGGLWALQSSLGMHPLNATANERTAGVLDKDIDISYLSLEFVLRRTLNPLNENLWVGFGLGQYLPMLVQAPTSLSQAQTPLLLSAGFDLPLETRKFVLQFNYNMLSDRSEGGVKIQTRQYSFVGTYFF